jgi:SAM-dependent methyltransferase
MQYFSQLAIKLRNHFKFRRVVSGNRGMFPSQIYMKYGPNETFNGKKALNVGCGKCTYKAPNVTNLDGYEGEGVNVVWDLSKTPLPFEDKSFDFIIANHVLEHIPNWYECFKELARILKPGGTLEIWVPPVSSDAAFTYLDHINRIGQASFAGVGRWSQRAGSNLAAESDYAKTDVLRDLKLIKYREQPISTWWTIIAPECVMNWFSLHLRNVISEEGYTFTKLEPSHD